jgi:hypothetical protein
LNFKMVIQVTAQKTDDDDDGITSSEVALIVKV